MLTALLVPAILLVGCAPDRASSQRPRIAQELIADHCGACHIVPGVRTATGRVGPSLAGIAQQQVLAGYFSNSRRNMIAWIMHPQRLQPGNAMQDTGLTRAEAELVADYLYTLD